MPQIKSFKGIFYNNKKVDIAKVVTPPYDVISDRMQENFYEISDYNIVRLILGKELKGDSVEYNKYTRAADYLNKWLNKKILIQDKEDSIYYLEEEYEINGEKKKRCGFIALSKLEDFNQGNILPHEKTMHGPKADRLKLTQHCKANFSQIFSVYSDTNGDTLNVLKQSASTPFITLIYDNIKYNLSKVTNKEAISLLINYMSDKKIFIADGHHRYETALAYRDYRRVIDNNPDKEMPYDYVMMYFAPIENNDLIILPTHRCIKNVQFNIEEIINSLNEYFHISQHKFSELKNLLEKLNTLDNDDTAFIGYFGGEFVYFLHFKDEIKNTLDEYNALDVQILQNYILEKFFHITQEDLDNKTKIEYVKDIEYGIELLKKGKVQGIFFMNPTKIEQVKNIALSGRKMPQKSTYFYPKLLTGLVINKIE